MNQLGQIVTIILTGISLFVIIIGGIGYLVGVFRKGKQEAATSEAAEIYEDLNKALKEKVGSLEYKLDGALKNIDTLNAKVSKLTQELLNYENIIVRSLQEYWENHPSEARALSQAREVKRKQ